MKKEFSSSNVTQTISEASSAKANNISKLLLVVILSVVLFGGAMFLLFAKNSAPAQTALAENSLETLPTTLTGAPTFTLSGSTLTGTGTDATSGYDFSQDVYEGTLGTDETLGSATSGRIVTLTRYSSSRTTQVVIPSQMSINENAYQVVIGCSYYDGFFSDSAYVTNISLASVSGEKVLATNCKYMFYQCFSLTRLDLNNFNTSNVTSMSGMFSTGVQNYGTGRYESALSEIVFGENFNTSRVKNMGALFMGCSNLTSLNLSKFDTRSVTKMYSMFSYCSSLTSLGLSNFDTRKVADMANMFSGCSANITFPANFGSAATSMSQMFNGYTGNSLDLSNFNTSKVEDMANMFSNCTSLETLLYTNMKFLADSSSLFEGLSSLKTIDLSNADTSNVTNMSYMFDGCSSLTSLDLSNFDTSSVTYMSSMFRGCSSLTSLGLSNFDTRKVADMANMFSGCSANITFPANFGSAATSMSQMFNGYTGNSLDLSNFNTNSVTDMSNMFFSCSGLTSLDLSSFDMSNVTNCIGMFNNCYSLNVLTTPAVTKGESLGTYGLSGDKFFVSTNDTQTKLAYSDTLPAGVTLVTSLEPETPEEPETPDEPIDLPIKIDSAPTFTYNSSAGTLTSTSTDSASGYEFSRDVYNGVLDTNITINGTKYSKVVTLWNYLGTGTQVLVPSQMIINGETYQVRVGRIFRDNRSLTDASFATVDGTGTKVFADTDCETMFSGCTNLVNLKLTNFTTPGAYSMRRMFSGCSKLESLDLSGFDTSSISNDSIGSMFEGCSSLTSLDLSSFNTRGVNDMSDMFSGCTALAEINFGSNFTTGNVTYIYGMFRNCSSLTSLDLSGFSTSNVTEMSHMFAGCTALSELTFGENFKTGKVTEMNSMFYNCSSLTSLDLSSFITTNVKKMTSMFNRCTSLKSLILGPQFKMSNVTAMPLVFATGSSLDVLDLSGVIFNSMMTDQEDYFAMLGVNKSYIKSYAMSKGKAEAEAESIANSIFPEGQEPNAEALATFMDKNCYFDNYSDLAEIAKAVLNTKIAGRTILPGTVNGLVIALPADEYRTNVGGEYSETFLKGYTDLGYAKGAELQNKNYAPALPDTPTETGVATDLLFALSGVVVVAMFAVAVAHVGKRKRVVKK